MLEKMKSSDKQPYFCFFLSGAITLLTSNFILILCTVDFKTLLLWNDIPFERLATGGGFLSLISFLFGFIALSIKEMGFNYYTMIYKKQKALNKRRTLYSRIIFYTFRKGTIVEECLENKRNNDEYTLEWIKKSKKVSQDVLLFSQEINRKYPEYGVMQSYYYNHIFQVLEFVFLIQSAICFLLSISFVSFKYINIQLNNVHTRQTGILFFLFFIFFILHKICRSVAKAYAGKFIRRIEVGLKSSDLP